MAKLLVLYTTPDNPDHFARYFHETHMAEVLKLPSLHDCNLEAADKVGQ